MLYRCRRYRTFTLYGLVGELFIFGEHSNNFLSGDCTFFLFDFSTLIFSIFGRASWSWNSTDALPHHITLLPLALALALVAHLLLLLLSLLLLLLESCCPPVPVPIVPDPVQVNCPVSSPLLACPSLPSIVASTILALACSLTTVQHSTASIAV